MLRKKLAILSAAFLVFSAAASADVTVQQALADGCYSTSEMKEIIRVGEGTFPAESVTLEKSKALLVSEYGQKITTSKVTAAGTWVYRGYETPGTDNWHVRKLLEGVIYSKGQNSRDKFVKGGGSAEAFWQTNGPDLLKPESSFPSATYITMRLLALQTSDTPPSQFVSFALNYKTAAEFGEAVYAFQVNPNSQILGLVNCKLGGEFQFQIIGGTRFETLYRKNRGEADWKKYNPASKTWTVVPKGTVPE